MTRLLKGPKIVKSVIDDSFSVFIPVNRIKNIKQFIYSTFLLEYVIKFFNIAQCLFLNKYLIIVFKFNNNILFKFLLTRLLEEYLVTLS